MTTHAPNTTTFAWRCETPGCHEVGAGFASDRAAKAAEDHHLELAHHKRAEATP